MSPSLIGSSNHYYIYSPNNEITTLERERKKWVVYAQVSTTELSIMEVKHLLSSEVIITKVSPYVREV